MGILDLTNQILVDFLEYELIPSGVLKLKRGNGK